MRVLVLQHIACEPPGVYEDVLREHGAAIHRVELDEGESLPDPQGFDAIVCMGGPMGAYDDEAQPWLAGEKRAIGEAVRAGVPFWGVCLGVQLLAASLRARVYPGPAPEVGLLPVQLTEEGRADPVFAGLPDELLTLQWHGDTFDLPEGAVRLASSPAYPNQAFRVGDAAYGVQFHVEVSPELAREWAGVPEYAEALERVLGPGALEHLIAALDSHAESVLGHGRRLFERWLEVAVAPARAGAESAIDDRSRSDDPDVNVSEKMGGSEPYRGSATTETPAGSTPSARRSSGGTSTSGCGSPTTRGSRTTWVESWEGY